MHHFFWSCFRRRLEQLYVFWPFIPNKQINRQKHWDTELTLSPSSVSSGDISEEEGSQRSCEGVVFFDEIRKNCKKYFE